MAKPSLTASQLGVQIAQQRLRKTGQTKEELRTLVGCSRQPITNFFQGKAIAQSIFMHICDRLDLNWQEIAGLSQLTLESATPVMGLQQTNASIAIDDQIRGLRQETYPSIRERCGTIRVLDMSHPIEVNDIYISVNVLEQITGRQHRRIDELLRDCDSEDFDRVGLGQPTEEYMPALDAVQTYQKLIVLGKPGAGKTTFLKHLAIQCNEGHFEPGCLPVFITLKNFAEADDQPNLLQYISLRDLNPSVPVHLAKSQDHLVAGFHQVFHAGRALILLDGLDEVRPEDYHRVMTKIRSFSEQYWQCQFVITCRIAAWDYLFEKFTEVEVADFGEAQIAAFAMSWFKDKPVKPETFLKHLDQNPRIKQLTVSPLLLTLVCLAFEESGDCPSNRSELYKEGIDALLKKWDAKRGIQRDQVYKNLSHQRKEDLLSYVALITFKQKDYFFKQTLVEQYIADYIRNFSRTTALADELQLDSEAILRSIEAQHGLLIERAKRIYSFSHLTFHEYFAAREIAFHSSSLAMTCQELVAHVTEKRWREVFLLISEMLRDASLLLVPMKQAVDQVLAASTRLQDFLQYVGDRANAPEFYGFAPAAVRAFYFDIDFDIDENRAVALQLDRTVNLLVCASFLARMLDGVSLQKAIAIACNYDQTCINPSARIVAAQSANTVMLIAIKIALESRQLETDERKTLKMLLQRLKDQRADDEAVKQVADEARTVAKTRHQIGQEWHFTPSEKALLRQYYYATQVLVECLHSDGCLLSPELRHTITNELFLPFSHKSLNPIL